MDIYVLQVIAGKEKQALKSLETLAEKSGKENRIFFPRRELTQRKSGRRYRKIQPLFPGYLFLETPKLNNDFIHDAVHLPQVIHFLPKTRGIIPISREDAERLKPFLKGSGLTKLVNIHFDENDRIVILEGPLKGQEGLIVKVDRRRRRMRVRLNLYDKGHLVDFGYQDLGKAP